MKLVLRAIGIVFIVLLLIFLFNYLIAERYIFPEPEPFSGKYWYNPYQDLDAMNWRRTNLHMHSRVWGGITSGSNNASHEVWDLYRKLGYESIGISNYQHVDTLYSNEPYYIPVYEHGYGIFRSHQLSLGARKVVWYDLPFGQNVHHKQYILNRLKKNCEMVAINHPSFFGGYQAHDFRSLTNYDLIEVLSGRHVSVPYWDAALSAGKPAFLIANDDMHDISRVREVSHKFMMVNSPDNHRNNILESLRKGNAYGVHILMPPDETYEGKMARFETLPKLSSVTIQNDTLKIAINAPAKEIRFFGQNGKLLSKTKYSAQGSYPLQEEDTYVRAVVIYSTPNQLEYITLYLNPVLRTPDGKKPGMGLAKPDNRATWTYRIIGLSSVLFVIASICLLRKRIRKHD